MLRQRLLALRNRTSPGVWQLAILGLLATQPGAGLAGDRSPGGELLASPAQPVPSYYIAPETGKDGSSRHRARADRLEPELGSERQARRVERELERMKESAEQQRLVAAQTALTALDSLALELQVARTRAAEARDMVLASCLLPYEQRARELVGVARESYGALLQAATEEDASAVPYHAQVMAVLPSIERRIRTERSTCAGAAPALYVEAAPSERRGLFYALSAHPRR